MGFSKKIIEDALISSGRHCCLCHKFCGTKIELHHIEQRKNGGEDSFDNCLPLCFDCHADVMQYNPDHPKGKKYSISELKKHRDNWFKKVEESAGSIVTNSNYPELDKKTFKRLNELLKSDGLMLFIKHNGFVGGPFEDKIFMEINAFIRESELPEFEFIDADLEGLKSELVNLMEQLDELILNHTFGASHGRQAIPSEWEYEQFDRMQKAISDFKELTPKVSNKYEEIIKLGRRKLYAN
ncbi:MAG: HNH endonuclease [Flavobacteriaceae bacterium]|nr:HNH endonuclease [Flavobacteriaceae bacterium]